MKKLFSLSFALISCFGIQAQSPILYLNINSHSETSDPLNYSNSTDFATAKAKLLQIKEVIETNKAKWNMQLDSNFILGAVQNDQANSSSTDILQAFDNSDYIEVDPHNHFNATTNPYNYSDLDYLLETSGLTKRKNMGGFLYDTASDFMPYQVEVKGNTYTTFKWMPNVIWGAGSMGHTNDYNGYGVWKPKGAGLNFTIHDSTKKLTYIGNGCSLVIDEATPATSYINDLIGVLNWIAEQPLAPNAFYTATVQFNFRDLNSTTLVQKISDIVTAMKPFVATQQVIWSTLTEKYDTWNAQQPFATDSFRVDCSSVVLSNPVYNESDEKTTIFPNPVHETLYIHQNDVDSLNTISIYNALGQKVLEQQQNPTLGLLELSVESLQNGIYFIKTNQGSIRFIKN